MKTAREPKVKLTLSVKKSAIENAKKYAQLDGASLSNIVEDYLVEYSKSNKADDRSKFKDSLAYQLMGCAKDGPLSNMTDDEIKDMRIKDRYGL